MFTTTENPTNSTVFAPKIAIVIPVFKHSVLVAEAIACALEQDTKLSYIIIIVNDGCKFPETDQVGREFALAYPHRVIYLYRPNGGLSAARNTGIEFALNSWDTIEAVYLLDADNRIGPHTIERSYQALSSEPEVGWVYPTIDMFGKEEGEDFDYRGEYSILRHLRFNTCEAGSMIRREVFERGCRYDESMTLGFEDWEFWWQAIAVGYRGKHLPESGFQYRKRFESMLSNSERDGQGIKAYIRRKHRNLLTHQRILGWEQQEAPRYAIFLTDTQKIVLTTDPTLETFSLNSQEFIDYYHRGQSMPVRYHRPYFLVFTTSTVLRILQEQALVHGVFWHLEQAQARANFAFFGLEHNCQESALVMHEADGYSNLIVGENDHLIMTNASIIDECIRDEQEVWIHSLVSPQPMPKVAQIQLKLPQSALADIPTAASTYGLLATYKTLRRRLRKRDQQVWDWHGSYLPPRSLMFDDARLALDCRPVYPKITNSQQKHVGFILSILEFGGVEKVALNLAKVFYEAGWQVHLFVFGTRMQQLPDWADVFNTVNFYHEPAMSPWQGQKYQGTKADAWSDMEGYMKAKGLLGWLNVAINFHNATVNNIMGQLRRWGVTTVMSLHVHDLSPWNRPAGYTYLTLGYEHAYDLIVPCSQNMADWCHAMGVPEDKTIVVSNACGYPLAQETVQQILHRRKQRGFTGKLRVLFMGRLDRQKGLDRLVSIIEQANQINLPIHWRLVGKNVIKGEDAGNQLKSIENLIEPPALTTESLNQLYQWADVLLFPSYWEGLPLTVIEAMRLGVVVCASDVGAVTEVVKDQQTGFVIPHLAKEMYVDRAIAFLQELIDHPTKLNHMSQAAAASASDLSWSQASTKLLNKLDKLFSSRQKNNT